MLRAVAVSVPVQPTTTVPPPDIGIGTVHETVAHALETDSGGLPHLAYGTLL